MIHRIKAGEIPMDVGSGEKEWWVGEKGRMVKTNPSLPVCFHGHTRYFLLVSFSSSFAQSFSVYAVTLKGAGSEAGGEGPRPWRMNEVADDT